MADNNAINLEALNVEQLNQLKVQLENELKQYANSYAGLRQANARFQESKTSLEALQTTKVGQDIYIPLTPSMYVPGQLSDVSKVLVDVGTGYYVEKSVPEASAFMERKMTFLQGNTTSLMDLMEGKRSDLQSVIAFMQQKLKSNH